MKDTPSPPRRATLKGGSVGALEPSRPRNGFETGSLPKQSLEAAGVAEELGW